MRQPCLRADSTRARVGAAILEAAAAVLATRGERASMAGERLMRPPRVVLADPVIDGGLRLKQRRERPELVEQLAPQRLMEALDRVRRGRRARLGEPARDPGCADRSCRTALPPQPNRLVHCLPLRIHGRGLLPRRRRATRLPVAPRAGPRQAIASRLASLGSDGLILDAAGHALLLRGVGDRPQGAPLARQRRRSTKHRASGGRCPMPS